MAWRRSSAAALALTALAMAGLDAAPTRAAAPPATAYQHLQRIVALSPAPQYRRFGSAGMVAASDYAAATLAGAGYTVVRPEAAAPVWTVNYAAGHEPMLRRLPDGRSFPTEATFFPGVTTSDTGLTCVVRDVADVGPGECGFVPFAKVSPEWNNELADVSGQLDAILARGGVGAILQGDVSRQARIALKARKPLVSVVSLVQRQDVINRPVRIRSQGAARTAALHSVLGVRRPADPSKGYVILQAHLDGWFTAAVDNGGGAAAVLAAAQRLAKADLGRGLIVALYDGEEWGLAGSQAVTDQMRSGVGIPMPDGGLPLHLWEIDSVVNLDAPSARPSDVDGGLRQATGSGVPLFSWRAMVMSEDVTVAPAFLTVMAEHQVLGAPVTATVAEPANGGMDRTDGKWFNDVGIPVVWPVAGYPEYHTDADTLAAVDPVDLQRVTDATVELVERISG